MKSIRLSAAAFLIASVLAMVLGGCVARTSVRARPVHETVVVR